MRNPESIEVRIQRQHMEIGLSPTSPAGVVMARYSNRFSRMWAWDVDSQEILGFQDVKGKARLLDVSEDGRYCGWVIEAKGGYDTHMGVSRPYSFHALFWRRTVITPYFYDPIILFEDGIILHYSQPEEYQFGDEIERVQPGCPYEFVELDGKAKAARRTSRVISNDGNKAQLIDRCGRTIEFGDLAVLSDGQVLIDLTRPVFTTVPHPEWAKEW
jgi:hypothetical protein